MGNWETLVQYIDNNEDFTGDDLKALNLKTGVINQYKSYLKKAKFIERPKPNIYRRLKLIGTNTIYKVKAIGYELEEF